MVGPLVSAHCIESLLQIVLSATLDSTLPKTLLYHSHLADRISDALFKLMTAGFEYKRSKRGHVEQYQDTSVPFCFWCSLPEWPSIIERTVEYSKRGKSGMRDYLLSSWNCSMRNLSSCVLDLMWFIDMSAFNCFYVRWDAADVLFISRGTRSVQVCHC